MFTYTKDRTPFLEEPLLDPRPSYNLVVEDAEGFSGWAGIDRIEGTDQRPAGLVSPFGPLERGYATEANRLLLDFGFSTLCRATMWATADPANLASIRVLEKSGLTNRGPTDPVQTWRGLRPRVLFEIEAE